MLIGWRRLSIQVSRQYTSSHFLSLIQSLSYLFFSFVQIHLSLSKTLGLKFCHRSLFFESKGSSFLTPPRLQTSFHVCLASSPSPSSVIGEWIVCGWICFRLGFFFKVFPFNRFSYTSVCVSSSFLNPRGVFESSSISFLCWDF